MDFLIIASAWHDFRYWFDHLDSPNKIAYWTFLASIGAAMGTAVVGYFAALIGAKQGAKAAFDLGRAQQEEELQNRRFSALNIAQYMIMQHFNTLAIIRDKNLVDYHNDNGSIQVPQLYLPESVEPLPMKELYFIADSIPAILRGIEIADNRYSATLNQFRAFREITEKYRGGDIGKETYDLLENWIKRLNAQIEHLLPLFEKVILDIQVYRKELYPNQPAIELERYQVKYPVPPKPNRPTESYGP